MKRNFNTAVLPAVVLASAFAAAPAQAILQCPNPNQCSFYNMPIYDQLHPSLLALHVPQNVWDLGQSTSTPAGTWTSPGSSALCGPTSAAMVHRAAYLHKDPLTKVGGWTATSFENPPASPEVVQTWVSDPNAPDMTMSDLQRLINMSIKQSDYNGHASAFGGGGTASRMQAGDFYQLKPTLSGGPHWGPPQTTFSQMSVGAGASCNQYLGGFDNAQFINFIKQGAAAVIAHNSFPEVITIRGGGRFEFHDFTTVTDASGNAGQSVGGHILAVNGFTRIGPPQVPTWLFGQHYFRTVDFLQIFDPWNAQKFSVSLQTKVASTVMSDGKFITTILPNPTMAVFSVSPNNDVANHPTWNAIYQFVACFDTTQVL